MKWDGDWIALGIGAAITLVATIGGSLLKMDDSFGPLAFSGIVYFASALALGLTSAKRGWISVLSVFGGIAIGIVIDALLRPTLFHEDPNLWPFGIVIYWVVGLVPIPLGYLVGWLIKRWTTRNQTSEPTGGSSN